eukprot:CAMPEP_0194356478 /NCGR_PEP_ID=MMETSP0174-20130528/4127_1 /TAXON_ID=216777 /ORGANISM="Proboscia alata, Strain PI-D3" /LENGTH=245 /DNA_ID=CAMNT_0039126091 /DNA_START=48 /DNA_END=785 /DNA_ORIENTATION=+
MSSSSPPKKSSVKVHAQNKSESTNDLTLLSCSMLILSDCMGTGILALPYHIRIVLGDFWGVVFVLLNLPINLYAGYILGESAKFVESKNMEGFKAVDVDVEEDYGTKTNTDDNDDILGEWNNHEAASTTDENNDREIAKESPHHENHSTIDFIGVTGTLFRNSSFVRRVVIITYYTNIFLVLGNYILVMSHAVRAIIGEEYICIPTSGVIASTLMFSFSQIRTMAKLGRSATVISLTSVSINQYT